MKEVIGIIAFISGLVGLCFIAYGCGNAIVIMIRELRNR